MKKVISILALAAVAVILAGARPAAADIMCTCNEVGSSVNCPNGDCKWCCGGSIAHTGTGSVNPLIIDAAGCGNPPVSCKIGYTCSFGKCVPTKNTDQSCGYPPVSCKTGYTCSLGKCVPAKNTDQSCGNPPVSCKTGFTCSLAGKCVPAKNTDQSCGNPPVSCKTDFTCSLAGKCVPKK